VDTVQSQDSFGRRTARALTRLFLVLLVVALVGVVGVLLAQLNARTFTVEKRGDSLVVLKGRHLPWGAGPYAPGDARLADAYAPVPALGQEPPTLVGRRFGDRDELDRALFDLLSERAAVRIHAENPEVAEQGLYYLRRVELLSGLTEEQRRSLKKLQAEAAFSQARSRLDDARRLVAEAMTQLRLAAESSSQHARTAHQMLSEVGPSASALEESLRRAVHTLSNATPPPAQAPRPRTEGSEGGQQPPQQPQGQEAQPQGQQPQPRPAPSAEGSPGTGQGSEQ
jgi:hypothetical protein